MFKKSVCLTAAIFFCAAFTGSTDKVGAPAPPFTGTMLDGKEVSLSDYQGKVLLLDFWASWCGPCRKELPFLIDLHKAYHDAGFEVVAVNIDDDVKNAQAFLTNLERKTPFPIVVDPEKQLPSLYEIGAMPTSLFVDKQGIVRYWHDGFKESDRSRYRDELRALLDKE